MTRADVIARFIPNRIQVHNLFNGLYTHSLHDPKVDKLYAKSPNGYKVEGDKVGLNLAFGLVTSCNGCQTA